ncbi:hypothetical protein DFJ77DRAFT_438201 [Powellomyces hirtus]|nr:hypothetical protein DFJ77DRAFT_508009 [Powellomyces hirtus]KAI8919151.1 hypothetical protein DFJ77DRAFT_438201 [Powellomyces hirtus]
MPTRQTAATYNKKTDIFHTPAQHPEFLNDDTNIPYIFHTQTTSTMQPVKNQSFVRDLSQVLWMLELPNNKKLDGKEVDVQEFCSRLRGEVEMAVHQGCLTNMDNARKYLSHKHFTCTMLTWSYSVVDRYKTFDDFFKELMVWFGTKQTSMDRHMAVLTLKKKLQEMSRAFVIPLRPLNKALPRVSQLNDQEKKYTFLECHQKPSMKSILVKGKCWDKVTITFDNLLDKV